MAANHGSSPNRGKDACGLPPSSFNRALRANLADAGYVYADQFSSHCFRRGATQELFNAGSSTDTTKSVGCWDAMGFRSYIDTQMADALKIARLVASAVNSDSDEDMDAPVNVAFGLSLKKRLKVFPTGEMEGRKA